MFLPDTNAWIRFLNPGENLVKTRFLSIDPSTILLCSVVKAELFYGAMKSQQINKNLGLLDSLFLNFESFPFDDNSARIYGELRSALARKGTPIGPNDLMIASIAIQHQAILVTHNTKEFTRIPELTSEDWE
jgi:tRNA(fMet)-specific endonuclease VapC